MKNRITQEVLNRFNNREELAFKKIFYGYYMEVFVYIERNIRDKQESETLCITAMHKLWKCEKKFSNENDMRSYLFSIARNTVLNYVRSRYKKERDNTSEIDDERLLLDETEYIQTHELFKSLYEYIETLPDQCKEVVYLTMYGLSSKEISKKLNISVSAVDVQRHRAIKKLRSMFGADKTALFLIHILCS